MEALGVMNHAVALIELAKRVASMAQSIYQIDQQDISSVKTDIDLTRNHLLGLQAGFEGSDIGRIILQCVESGANASAILRRLGTADYSERVQFARSIRTGLSGLDEQLAVMILRWIQYVNLAPLDEPDSNLNSEHNLEVPQLLRRASMICRIPQPQSFTSIPCKRPCLLPAIEPRQPYGSALLHLLTSNVPASSRKACERSLKNHILTEISNGQGRLSSHIQMTDPAMERDIQRSFLCHLRDHDIGLQKASARETHTRSFDWLFESSSDRDGNGTDFRNWVTSPSSSQPTFWITGMPGSGKSTLMEVLNEHLRHEALSRRTNVVSYFFVYNRPNQKGVKGLVQSILHQLLSKSPELIPFIAPSRWDTLVLFGEDPKPIDIMELQQLLVSTLRQGHQSYSTFILIDALDECEVTKGDLEIRELLSKITACPNTKVCISSRYLPHLQSLIDGAPRLILENCNKRDIEDFITSKIEAQFLLHRHSIISLGIKEQLIYELTIGAEGCFLWAVLATDAIRKLVTERHGDDDLLRFVNNVPKGLTRLFRCFLDELDASQPFVASTLRFIATFNEPITPLRLFLMEMPFPDFTLRQNSSYLSWEELHIRSRESSERIIDASWGLLKAATPLKAKNFDVYGWNDGVGLRHRSFGEFLRETIRSSPPVSMSPEKFAARYSAASLSILKISPIGHLTVQSVTAEAIRCSYIAMFAGTVDEVHVSHILDELEWTCHGLLDSLHPMQSSWLDIETHEFAYSHNPIKQSIEEQRPWNVSNFSMPPNAKMSASLQIRAMTLCTKYSLTAWEGLQKIVYHWPGYYGQISTYKCQCRQRDIKYDSSMIHKGGSERGQNSIVSLLLKGNDCYNTRNMEGCDHNSLTNDMEDVGAVQHDTSNPDDHSDNMSWESWSSAESSLDDRHPLMALKKEAIDVVFQGYMEYRKRRTQGTE
ncbi:hypothetical protein F5Y08DRAFT_341737 [Xylaria arbuscula]|nr:hypothetical protein F5Y08DRAFT_341737 [Xylaria arbuscula]